MNFEYDDINVLSKTRPQIRELTEGAKSNEILQKNYESLVRYNSLDLIGRVFHANGTARTANVSFADCPRNAPNPKTLINLGSSDYAGLNKHPRVLEAAMEALKEYGIGSGGGRLLNGTSDLHIKLERKLADFLGKESVVTFNSGYCANLSALSCLCSKGDIVITDILNHQSILDGLKLGEVEYISYVHNRIRSGARSVEGILKSLPDGKRKFIVTDGIFSMDGDIANLKEIVELAEKYGAYIIVDEAHGIGTCGPQGRGVVAQLGLQNKVDVITGVLSKALPGIGGFVAGSEKAMDLLRYSAGGYIFSTALPPSTVAGLIEAIDILIEDNSIQEKLHRNIAMLKTGINEMGLDTLNSESAVLPILMPDAETTLVFARMLHDDNIFANIAGYPTVSVLRPRIRLSVNASLEASDIEYVLSSIKNISKALGLIATS